MEMGFYCLLHNNLNTNIVIFKNLNIVVHAPNLTQRRQLEGLVAFSSSLSLQLISNLAKTIPHPLPTPDFILNLQPNANEFI